MQRILRAKLDTWLFDHKDCPKQDTPEWHKERLKTIGGSEMATIQGMNRFSSVTDIIAGKIGLKPRFRNVRMQWGKLFEFVICAYVEYDFDTKMEAQDLFVKGRFAHQSYSPDGVGIVELEYSFPFQEPIEDEYERHGIEATKNIELTYKDYSLALFEFKCPFSRPVGPHGVIPDCYLPQVMAGLDTIDICDIGIYAEAMFRKCCWTDVGLSSVYDKSMTPNDTIKSSNEVLAYGFILYYRDAALESDDDVLQDITALDSILKAEDCGVLRANSKSTDLMDIGNCSMNIFEVVMDNYESRHIKAFYSSIYTPDTIVNNIEQQESWPKFPFSDDASGQNIFNIEAELDHTLDVARARGYDVYGVLPWKLFKISYTFVQKEIGYLDKHMHVIDEIMQVVDKCRADPDNKLELFNEYKSNGVYGRIDYEPDMLDLANLS